MKQITREFLNGGMIESDFYNLPKEDLITLKEYLLKFRTKDKEFFDLTKIQVKK